VEADGLDADFISGFRDEISAVIRCGHFLLFSFPSITGDLT
jgi:hypothetical protein